MSLGGGALMVLVALMGLLYDDFASDRDHQLRTAHSYQVHNAIQALLSSLQDAETGQRGYLLTGDESYREPFQAALRQGQLARQNLRQLTGGSPATRASLDMADRLVEEEYSELWKTMALRRQEGFDAALEVVRTGEGKRIMGECRAVLRAMEDEDRLMLARRTQVADVRHLRMRWTLGLGGGSLLMLLVVAGAVIERDGRNRERARQVIQSEAEAVREREHDLRRFAEFAPVAIAMFDREMRYLAASLRFRDDYSLGNQELVGRSHYDVFPEMPDHWRDIHRRCLAGSVERNPGEAFLRSDGTEQWIRWEIQPWDRGGGEIGGIILFSEDITHQKLAERALRESESRLRLAQQVARIGTFEWNWQTGVNTWTPELEAMYGLDPGEFSGAEEAWENLIHPDDRGETLRQVQEAMETGKFEAEWRVVWPDGTLRWLAGRAWVFKDEAGNPLRLIGINIDITERRAAEAVARRWQRVFEQAELAIALSDSAAGTFQTVNQSFARERGYTVSEMAGFPISRLFPEHVQADLRDFVAVADREGHVSFESEHRRKDGTSFPVRVDLTVIQNDHGDPVNRVAFSQDLTAQKMAEQQIRQLNAGLEKRVRERTAQLEAANRELEAFAYSVSHDLRAPLRGIDGWSLALAEDYAGQLDAQALRYLDRVRSETQRMGLLIDDLLQLSSVTRTELLLGPVDLTAAARSIAARLTEANPGRQLEFVIEAGLSGTGDARLLEVVLTNLLSNAVKFTGPIPQARIEFGHVGYHGQAAFFVRDNGVGFDMTYADRLFCAFQRLHKTSEFPGTGIGLAIVQRVIHRHGGRVWAESQIDQGAEFLFTIGETE